LHLCVPRLQPRLQTNPRRNCLKVIMTPLVFVSFNACLRLVLPALCFSFIITCKNSHKYSCNFVKQSVCLCNASCCPHPEAAAALKFVLRRLSQRIQSMLFTFPPFCTSLNRLLNISNAAELTLPT
jgi:hypothetical protein